VEEWRSGGVEEFRSLGVGRAFLPKYRMLVNVLQIHGDSGKQNKQKFTTKNVYASY
jgi:hypothetical protein